MIRTKSAAITPADHISTGIVLFAIKRDAQNTPAIRAWGSAWDWFKVVSALKAFSVDLVDKGRLRKRMRVHPEEGRTLDLVLFSISANRLGDGQKVGFIEAKLEGGVPDVPRSRTAQVARRSTGSGRSRIVRSHSVCGTFTSIEGGAGFPANALTFMIPIEPLPVRGGRQGILRQPGLRHPIVTRT